MPEQLNIEFAQQLTEGEFSGTERGHWEDVIEIVEVVVLAVVAVATAWSGYQAARWDGYQALLYGQSSHERFDADTASTYGGQLLVTDVSLFTAWLQADADNNASLQRILRKRMSPGYQNAFAAWLATNPSTNPHAPVGPRAMPQYDNPYFDQATALNERASANFDRGTHARETGEKYVRDTVLFASVLFLVAIAQRLHVRMARIGANCVAIAFLVFVLVSVTTLQRL